MTNVYEMKEIGFPGVVLLGGYLIDEEDGEEFVEIQKINGLHRAVAEAICSCDVELNSSMIRFLRDFLELTQGEFARTLKFSDRQMISYWERGEKKPSPQSQYMIKSKILAGINRTTTHAFADRLIENKSPEKFEFDVVDGVWKWVNSKEVQSNISFAGTIHAQQPSSPANWACATNKGRSSTWVGAAAFTDWRAIADDETDAEKLSIFLSATSSEEKCL